MHLWLIHGKVQNGYQTAQRFTKRGKQASLYKAIGGPGSKTCQAYFLERITVSRLFTEYQISTLVQRYEQFNFRGS